MPCQGHLVEVREQYDAIRRRGAEVVVVSFATPERLPAYRERHGWPFPVVSDPGRAAYRAFGLGSAGWGELLRPRVWLRYAALIWQGHRPRGTDEDVHQLGGDFVLDRQRRLVFAHRSTDPADRPAVGELLRALELVSTPSEPGSS